MPPKRKTRVATNPARKNRKIKATTTQPEPSVSTQPASVLIQEIATTLRCPICQDISLYHLSWHGCSHTICVLCYNQWCMNPSKLSVRVNASIVDGQIHGYVAQEALHCPLCNKKERWSGSTPAHPVPLMMSGLLDLILKDPSMLPALGETQILKSCPYCDEKFAEKSVYTVTLHLSTCTQRKLLCPKCHLKELCLHAFARPANIRSGLREGKELALSFEEHLRLDCTHPILCPNCDERVISHEYSQHYQTLCKPHFDKKIRLMKLIEKLSHPVRHVTIVDQLLELGNRLIRQQGETPYIEEGLDSTRDSYIRGLEMEIQSLQHQLPPSAHHIAYERLDSALFHIRDRDEDM